MAGSALSPFAVLADYERRSLEHSPGAPEDIDAQGLWRGVGFRLGERRLVSLFGEVLEIITLPPVTPVPGAQPWLLGVANVRGTLLPVADLKQFLEGERSVLHENQRALVVRQPGGNVAVAIDELLGQRYFTDEQRCDPGEIAQGRYAQFVTQGYNMGGVTYGVFNMAVLARSAEFRQAAAA
ncbi:MAG: pilus biogenesis protein [Lysobacteraceae bacterium]|nr:MAG: pilus biogenesis protein [Xanthomonadaceae bacterium]